MQLSLQPFTTAGIALVGASAIALSPLAPPPVTASATTTVSTAAVQLSAAVDPLTRWGQVAAATAENLTEMGTYMLANPLPLTSQMITNGQTYATWIADGLETTMPALQNWVTVTMPAAFEKAAAEWQAGEPAKATKTISTAVSSVLWVGLGMAGALGILYYVAEHAATLFQGIVGTQTMTTVASTPLSLFGAAINSVGATAQAATDAMEIGDTVGALAALANAPANLVDAVLNGRSGLLDFRLAGGGTIVAGGFVTQMVINLPERLASLITLPPPVAAAAAAPPAVTATRAVELPTADPTPAADAAPTSTSDSASIADSVPAPEVEATTAAVNASSSGLTNLSAGNKVEPGTAAARSAQRVKASLDNAADRVDERIKKLSSGIEKSVKKVTDNLAKAGKKKQTAGSTSSASAPNKAGTDSDA